MSSFERAEADWLEQSQTIVSESDDDIGHFDSVEVNPADAVDQRRDAGIDDEDDYPVA